MVGVILSARAQLSGFVSVIWSIIGLLILVPLLFKQRRSMIVLVVISGLIIGLWRGGLGQIGLDDYQQLIGTSRVVSGRVLEDADIDAKGQMILRLNDIEVDGHNLPGGMWVTLARSAPIQRSDTVVVSGKLTKGFGPFAAAMYRAEVKEVMRPVPGDVAVGLRNWFAERVNHQIPETEAALGLGFLLGLRRALPAELVEVLKIAGLTHVIVASGYNLTILVRLSRRLFHRVSKYLSMVSGVAMIVGFMAVTGMSPSMSRAGLVTGLSLATWYYGRTTHPLVLLPLAAAITLMINPQYGWSDLGWQLSFAAFAGVIILAPLVQRYFFGDKPPGNIRQILGETISAQVATLPILVLSFGVVSNVAVLANLLILPFVPLAMLLVFLVGILAYVPLIGVFLGTVSTWLLGYMISVANWLASQSWAQTEVEISWWHAGIFYVALIGVVWWMKRQTKYDLSTSSVVE